MECVTYRKRLAVLVIRNLSTFRFRDGLGSAAYRQEALRCARDTSPSLPAHRHILRLEKFLHAFLRAFAPEARLLGAADGAAGSDTSRG